MSHWIHLELNFPNGVIEKLIADAFPKKKPKGIYKELIYYLKQVIDSLSPRLVNRCFYLFEPNPHLFLALEAKDTKNVSLIRKKINQIKKPAFIEPIRINENSGDEGNGEVVLDFFHAVTKYAFYRVSDDYEPGYAEKDETFLIHCFCNQLFINHNNEGIFYLLKGLELRGLSFAMPKN